MLRSTQLCRAILDLQRSCAPIIVWSRGYNKEYEHAQLKVTHPDVPEFFSKDEARRRFVGRHKDHRNRLESDWKENRNQGYDPVLEKVKEENAAHQGLVPAPLLEDFSKLSGNPPEQVGPRHARIFSPARNAMQSGSYATRKWRIQFENQERWENPCMGWTSCGDPLSPLHIDFTSPEDAIAYCKRMGYSYAVEQRQVPTQKLKSYAANFAWNKNTRVPAK